MELYHCPRDIKLLMLKYGIEKDVLIHLIKHEIILPEVKLHIIYQYGDNEVYTLQNIEQGCKWMREVASKRRGFQQYYLERFVVHQNRLKKAKFFIEDVEEIQIPKLLELF